MASIHKDTTRVEYDELLGESMRAIKLDIDGSVVWIPKSQIDEHNEADNEVIIPVWLALEKRVV